MAFTDATQMMVAYGEIIGDATKLVDILTDDANTNMNDWCHLSRIRDQLVKSILPKFSTYVDFLGLMKNVESDKDRILIQKAAKNQKDDFFSDIESFITMSKTWNFEDSRITNWQQRWCQFMLDFKVFCLVLFTFSQQ